MTEDADNKSKEVIEVKTPVKSVGEVEPEPEQETELDDSGEEKRRCPSLSPSRKTTTTDEYLLNISF